MWKITEQIQAHMGLKVREIMTPDGGLQKAVLVPKDKNRTWDVDLFAEQCAFPFTHKSNIQIL